MRRKIPAITLQARHAKKMERLLVMIRWKSINQANIYLTEEHESLQRWHQRRITHPCLIKVYIPRTVKSKQINLMYEEMIEALYQEKDGRSVIKPILNCSESTDPADIEWRGMKRACNQTVSLTLKTIKPGEDATGNTMNLGKDIRTFFKPAFSKPKKLKTSPEKESVINLD